MATPNDATRTAVSRRMSLPCLRCSPRSFTMSYASISLVPRHEGYFEHPQNRFPVRRPRAARRFRIALPQRGQATRGTGEIGTARLGRGLVELAALRVVGDG